MNVFINFLKDNVRFFILSVRTKFYQMKYKTRQAAITKPLFLMITLFLFSCPDEMEPYSVNSITISGDTTVEVLESIQLSASVDVSGNVPDGVMWSSSDESFATVDTNGLVSTHSYFQRHS